MVSNVPFTAFEGSVVDIVGVDADKIFHNLTTNDVKSLESGQAIETFVTEVRGRTVGHGYVFRIDEGFRFVGSPGQSEAIAAHVDRYTIREDAAAIVRDQDFCIEVCQPDGPADGEWIPVLWLGEGTRIRCILNPLPCPAPVDEASVDEASVDEAPVDGASTVAADVAGAGQCETSRFHDLRIDAGYPWHGIDFDDSNLPQELDRDDVSVSFTKGCYLGQETVARLDAMGQVQKKLVKLSLQSKGVKVGDVITVDEKPIARITSVSSDAKKALAMVRRAWFETGTQAIGKRADGTAFEAVIA